MSIKEGYMPFKEGKTYYRIVGAEYTDKAPLILLHGGPGSTHNYFEVLDELADIDHRMLVMYDQIGCGGSYIEGHPEYFTADTWIHELIELRKYLNLAKVHIMGQSWGGMQAIQYAIEYEPEGVQSYILSSTLSSASLWEKEQHRRISYMDQKYQDAIAEALETENWENPIYQEAVGVFMEKHCMPTITPESPECLTRPKKAGAEAYMLAWGPNEFTPTGTLAGFEFTDRLCEIKTPCLITDGQEDLCSPYIAKTLYDRIPNAKWEIFPYSKHLPFVDEHEDYMKVLIDWLNSND